MAKGFSWSGLDADLTKVAPSPAPSRFKSHSLHRLLKAYRFHPFSCIAWLGPWPSKLSSSPCTVSTLFGGGHEVPSRSTLNLSLSQSCQRVKKFPSMSALGESEDLLVSDFVTLAPSRIEDSSAQAICSTRMKILKARKICSKSGDVIFSLCIKRYAGVLVSKISLSD